MAPVITDLGLVDILFESEGDQGFWQSLSSVAKKARCPIILTAQTPPSQLVDSQNIRHLHSGLSRPSPYECASKMVQICKMEGMRWQPGLDQNQRKHELAQIAKYCGCDVRRIMNEMQLYGLGHTRSPNSGTLTQPSLSHCVVNNIIDVSYPQIDSIFPDTVKSYSYSVITIEGKHFDPDSSVQIMVGDQICPVSKTMNSSTILVVVPPCQIPGHVDKFGYVKDNATESLSTRYATVQMSTTIGNGYIVRSDSVASIARSRNQNDFGMNIFLQYSFPDPDDMEDTVVEKEIDPAVLLEDATNAFENAMTAEEDTKMNSHSPVVSCTPISQSKNDGDQIAEISKHFEILSDCYLQRDVNESLSLPPLAGAMCELENTGIAEPSPVELGGWGGPEAFRGSYDSFVTAPKSRRDRLLISKQSIMAEGFSSFSSESVPTSNDDDEDEDIEFYRARSANEESYIPLQNCNRSGLLPDEIFDVKKYDDNYSRAAEVGILDHEGRAYWDSVTETVDPLFDQSRL